MGRPTGPIGLTRAFVSWAGLGWAQPWLGLGRVGLALFGPGLAHWKACLGVVHSFVVVAGAWIFLATMVWWDGGLNSAVFLLDFWRVGRSLMAGEEGGVSEREVGGGGEVSCVGDWGGARGGWICWDVCVVRCVR